MSDLINVRNAIYNTRAILNGSVGKYDFIRFIGIDEDNDNKYYYLTAPIKEGFYYKPSNRTSSENLDTIKIVPKDEDVEEAIYNAVAVDLINDDGSFVRFTINEPKTKPKRPSFQWILEVKANEQDNRVII